MDLLDLYTAYVAPMKGSIAYHRWAFLSIISALLERRVWLDRGRFGVLFPNTYTVLVGHAGNGKTHSADVCVDMFLRVAIEGRPYPHKAPSKITQAALYKELKTSEREYLISSVGKVLQCPIFLYASELSRNMEDFGGGLLTSELIDFYDSKSLSWVESKRLISDGELKLNNPSITLLGCSTQNFLQQAAKMRLITSGLSSRILFVVDDTRIEKQRDQVALDKVGYDSIIHGLTSIFSMQGPMTLADDAQTLFKAIADEGDDFAFKNRHNEFFANYYARKSDHIMKCAMVFTGIRNRYGITVEDINKAKEWIDAIEPQMISAFGIRSIERDTDASEQIRMQLPLEPAFMSQSELMMKLITSGRFMPMNHSFDAIMKTLITSGEVIVRTVGTGSIYYARKNK